MLSFRSISCASLGPFFCWISFQISLTSFCLSWFDSCCAIWSSYCNTFLR